VVEIICKPTKIKKIVRLLFIKKTGIKIDKIQFIGISLNKIQKILIIEF